MSANLQMSSGEDLDASERAMLDALPSIAFVTDARGATLYANALYQEYAGLSAEALSGGGWTPLLHPEDRERIAAAWQGALGTGEPVEVEYRLRGADGADRWFRGRASPQRDERGQVWRWIGTLTDIHDLKTAESWARKAQKALAGRERQLQTLTDAMPALISFVDDERRYRFVNKYYESWFPRRREEILGRPLWEIMGHAAYAAIEHHVDAALRGERLRFEQLMPYADIRPRHISVEFIPRQAPDGRVEGFYTLVQDISAQKSLEAELRESEERFRLMADSSPALIWVSDEQARITFVNKRYEEVFGRPTDDLTGEGWRRIIHPEDLPGFAGGFLAAFEARQRFQGDVRVIDRSGDVLWLHCEGVPRFTAEGQFAGFVGVNLDVTEAKRAEEALRESEDHYRTSVELHPQVNWTATPDGQLDQVSSRWMDLTGTIALGTGWAEAIHPEDLGPSLAAWTHATATGEPYDIEHRVRLTDGSHHWMHSRAFPRRDEDGRIVKWYGTTEDIQERKAAEEGLREESRTLGTLNRAGAMLAAELDPERLVQSLTDAGVEITGARFGAFFHNIMDDSGEKLHLFTLSGADRSDFEGMGGVRATGVFGPTFRNEGVVRSEDILADPRYGHLEPHRGMPKGHLPVRSYLGVPVVSRSGEVLGGLLFGHPEPGRFTERHEQLLLGLAAQAAIALDNARLFQAVQRANETLEARVAERTDELLKAQEALQQSQKMEAVGQLTGGIAHDFNNLLTPIMGGLDIVRRRVTDDRSLRLLAGAMQSAERAQMLVSRLLAFARRQVLQPRPVRPAELIEGMRELIDRSLGPMIEVCLDVAPDLPPILVDPNQLELALLNLSVNARDAMPSGGRLTIAAEVLGAEQCPVPGLAPGLYVRLTVADTGVGMDETTLRRAVEPFFSTKGVGKGTGLGLSMVHGLAAQSGGLFKLASEAGKGTTAVIWLPVVEEEPDTPGAAEPVATQAPRSAVVLLVEDEPLVRMSTAEGLRELGYEVLEVGTAAEALEVLRVGLVPDALITDHMMPGMTGSQLAAELREHLPGLPVLMITGYAQLPPEQTRGFQVLTKPFRQAELGTILAEMLAKTGNVVSLAARVP